MGGETIKSKRITVILVCLVLASHAHGDNSEYVDGGAKMSHLAGG